MAHHLSPLLCKSQVERDVDELSRAGQLKEPERVQRQGGGSYPAREFNR